MKKNLKKNTENKDDSYHENLQVVDITQGSSNPLNKAVGQNLENITILNKEELDRFLKYLENPPKRNKAFEKAKNRYQEKYGNKGTQKSKMAGRKNENSQ